MPRARVVRESAIERTPRVVQLEGIFDVPPSEQSREEWDVELPLDDREWNVGLIVGPSGCGKTTIARELFGDRIVEGFDWPDDKALVDGFPEDMSVKEITMLLSRVGFSAPPAWMRPFHVLSNGEQFRATIARALAEVDEGDTVVVDEFTSVVDRTVAKIGSHAVAKTVRQRGVQFIAVTCHYDVVEWLQPDWVFEPAAGDFTWREVRRRPDVELEVIRVHRQAWELFKKHHYLTRTVNPTAAFYVALVEGQPAAIAAVQAFPHPKVPGWRISRVVCLPDYQGVGIGNALFDYVASLYRATGKSIGATMGHPALIHRFARSREWKMVRKPSHTSGGRNAHTKIKGLNKSVAYDRLTAGFRYVGPPRFDDAVGFDVITEPFAQRAKKAWANR